MIKKFNFAEINESSNSMDASSNKCCVLVTQHPPYYKETQIEYIYLPA
jgi:hypothetical protein